MLKIKTEHYETLRGACEDVLAKYPKARAEYAVKGLSDKRFRWDVLYSARIDGVSGTEWLCRTLYPYMNDEHMDSALRRIVG